MKFIHLSDLHIGKRVNGFSMLEEQRHVLRQIIDCIQSQKPAAVVIAGDVYDRAVPGVEAVEVFDNFLTALAGEGVKVLLISGNHDSPERISYASRLLADKGLFLRGTGFEKVTLSDEYGDVNFWLLPFIKPAYVRQMFPEEEVESYGDGLSAVIAAADVDYSARNVLVSHQYFTKANVVPIRSESELNPIGGLDGIDAGYVEGFDYVALGHLHGRQNVGADHIRYAGSPLKYSFSEIHQKKSLTVVELKEKGRVEIIALPLVPIHDMREIKGRLEALMSDEVSSQGDREDYLHVILTDEDEIVDPIGKIRSVYPNVMGLDFENTRNMPDIMPDAERTAQLSPYELFSEFYLDVNGSVMSEEQSRIVRDILETEAAE